MARTKVTMINSMAGEDFGEALDRHLEWGLSVLDLRDAIFGKRVGDLIAEDARRAAELIDDRGLSVHCLSTSIFAAKRVRAGGVDYGAGVGTGEEEFRREHLGKLERITEIAQILQPRVIRVHPPQIPERQRVENSATYLQEEHPWLIPLYAEASDYLHDAGFKLLIENEIGACAFSHPQEVVDFFSALDRRHKAGFTWDVQNMWVMGTFPTVQAYEELRPLIDYLHLKGGQRNGESARLEWQSSLEDASWPVVEITERIVADGVSPVICLNPSHGSPREGYDHEDVTERDLAYIRQQIPEVE